MKINTQKIELLAAKRGMTVTELGAGHGNDQPELQHDSPPGQLQGNYRCTHCPRPEL